ncbi:MAG: single-stranded DNA-binding protein, partial [Planctomycetota bacterium]
MANFNKVLLLGNLTRDVEMRHTQNGQALAKFGLAINRKWKSDSGEMKESTCFVDCTAWGRSAEVLSQYVRKGSPLFVEGRLEYSTWEDKNGGGKRSKLDVTVENFQLLGGGGSRGAGGGGGGEVAEEGAPRRAAGGPKQAEGQG